MGKQYVLKVYLDADGLFTSDVESSVQDAYFLGQSIEGGIAVVLKQSEAPRFTKEIKKVLRQNAVDGHRSAARVVRLVTKADKLLAKAKKAIADMPGNESMAATFIPQVTDQRGGSMYPAYAEDVVNILAAIGVT